MTILIKIGQEYWTLYVYENLYTFLRAPQRYGAQHLSGQNFWIEIKHFSVLLVGHV
jgi:hypothetical protein